MKYNPFQKITSFLLSLCLVLQISPLAYVSADQIFDFDKQESKTIKYKSLMRDFEKGSSTTKLENNFKFFIDSEEEKLKKLNISSSKKDAYLKRLKKQADLIKKGGFKKEIPEVKILENPAGFKSSNDIKKPEKIKIYSETKPDNKLEIIIPEEEKISYFINTARADEVLDLPIEADLEADEYDVIIDRHVKKLAYELEYNPVKIFDWVYNNIDYTPYNGAKRGSATCLKDKACNDTDAASLTIALLRASGVPARYKKALIKAKKDQLLELLGVDNLQAAYAALSLGRTPVYLTLGELGETIDDTDFTEQDSLALEWTFVEFYGLYDYRGGNFSNEFELQNVNDPNYSQYQWLNIDPSFKAYQSTQNEIANETLNFDVLGFWNSYFTYTGNLSPIDKYKSDISLDLDSEQYQSKKSLKTREHEILPPELPYSIVTANSLNILPESWTVLPENRHYKVKIALKDKSNNVVLEKVYLASSINNLPLDLYYEGATDQDKQLIESYGGIHKTPAELVDVVAVLNGDTSSALSIGQNLVMEFTYYLGNEELHSDSKFSFAGNSEGIFIDTTGLVDEPEYNVESDILYSGNAAIAQYYLVHQNKASEFLEKTFDLSSNIIFSRAVVTQTRALNEIDGSPTAFNFSGLNIDASTYSGNYSNRTDYKYHKKDYMLLSGLEASYYEAKIFEDITGIGAISTTEGLQYAYLNNEYTLHTIDDLNESVIDTLDLSQNTKANMHADVQNGKTVITPNKPIVNEAWSGIVYVSINEAGTANYAIGEQVQNGGFTVGEFLEYVFNNVNNEQVGGFLSERGYNNFYYYEGVGEYDRVACSASDDLINTVRSSQGYNHSYGVPCSMGTVQFGDYTHNYIHTSEASNFGSGWVTKSHVLDLIDQRVSVYSQGEKHNFSFSPKLGTYRQAFCMSPYNLGPIECQDGYDATIYYNPEHDAAYMAYGDFLYKLAEDNNRVVGEMGFPSSERIDAATSRLGTTGKYQNFLNGQIYWIDNLIFDDVYYVPNKIDECMNNPSICVTISDDTDLQGGTGGRFGFPISDPVFDQNQITQDFERGRILLSSGNASEGGYSHIIASGSASQNDVYWEGMLDQFIEEGIYGFVVGASMGVAIEFAIKKLSKKLGKKIVNRVIPLVGIAFFVDSVFFGVSEIYELTQACNSNELYIDGKIPAYYCGKRDAAIILVGSGLVVGTSGMKAWNKLGAKTERAIAGKYKLFELIKNDNQYKKIFKKLKLDPNVRNKFFEMIADLSDDDLLRLISDDKVLDMLINKEFCRRFPSAKKIIRTEKGELINNPNSPDTPSWNNNETIPTLKLESNLGNMSESDIIRVVSDGNSYASVWWLKAEDVRRLRDFVNENEDLGDLIRKYYSLPEKPTHFMKGAIKKDVEVRIGEVAPCNWSGTKTPGGNTQIQIVGKNGQTFNRNNWQEFMEVETSWDSVEKKYIIDTFNLDEL
jgi:hypothetical protein